MGQAEVGEFWRKLKDIWVRDDLLASDVEFREGRAENAHCCVREGADHQMRSRLPGLEHPDQEGDHKAAGLGANEGVPEARPRLSEPEFQMASQGQVEQQERQLWVQVLGEACG